MGIGVPQYLCRLINQSLNLQLSACTAYSQPGQALRQSFAMPRGKRRQSDHHIERSNPHDARIPRQQDEIESCVASRPWKPLKARQQCEFLSRRSSGSRTPDLEHRGQAPPSLPLPHSPRVHKAQRRSAMAPLPLRANHQGNSEGWRQRPRREGNQLWSQRAEKG